MPPLPLPRTVPVLRPRRRSLVLRWLVAALVVLPLLGSEASAVVVTFNPGSLIIPMDVAADGQNGEMLRAYGLVYVLLRNGIPVHWAILPGKPAQGTDFTITSDLQDVQSGAMISTPRAYRGGPFVIAAADAAAALPIIQAWQATSADDTVVHRLTSGSFTPNVARTLQGAPRIAVLKDGNEAIELIDLNAAGIPDSIGNVWSPSSPDLLTETQVRGPTTAVDDDGALFDGASGLPRYCHLSSMHYAATSETNEVAQEVRSWLDAGPLTSAFMQCEAAPVFENAVGGRYLTVNGLEDDGDAPSTPVVRVPDHPLSQLDGPFAADSGSTDSMHAIGGTYKPGVQTLINENGSAFGQRIVMMTGRLDGAADNGRVTYLAGHDYSVVLPITTNPQTNGVRLMLNTLFESDCATTPIQSDVVLTKSAPATVASNQIDYTINYSNPGPRAVENLKLSDVLPAGATYVAGSGVPAPTSTAGGVLTWNLPALGSGGAAAVTFSVTVSAAGSYANQATLTFSHLLVRTVSSNVATTMADAVGPTATATATPTPTPTSTPADDPTVTTTATPVEPTVTTTATPVEPTVTATTTPVEPTVTATTTPVEPTATFTPPVPTATPTGVPPSLCSGGPFVCKAPGRTSFTLRNRPNDKRDSLKLTLARGDATTLGELGNPTVDTRYTVCVWDDVAGVPTLVMEMEAPAGGTCNHRSCWRPIRGSNGFRYNDPGRMSDGLQALTLRSGPLGKATIYVKGRGALLPDPPMPFHHDPLITVQVVNSIGGCWGADYVNAPRANDGERLIVKERP